MKFNVAWAKTSAQNVTLKVVCVALTSLVLTQSVILGALLTKSLPVIERGCFSKAVLLHPLDPTKNEMEAFLVEALAMRFDSVTYLKEGFLSIEEITYREKEQVNLKQRQISQKIIINAIKIDDKDIFVSADRLLSVGKIKSVLTLNLNITIQQTNRTESNPYGLIISSVKQIEEKGDK